jgi:hypothetical protein
MIQLYKTYNQTTKLTKYSNCLLEQKPLDINSIYFWFDEYRHSIPEKYIPENTDNVEYKIVYITKDKEMNRKYDDCGVYYLYYKDNYVKSNYSIYYKDECCELIGKYILDWDCNNDIKNIIKKTNSHIIYLNYFLTSEDDE